MVGLILSPQLTVRTVHVWIVNICGFGSTVVGEMFKKILGPQLSVNTSRGVCLGGACIICIYCNQFVKLKMYEKQQ